MLQDVTGCHRQEPRFNLALLQHFGNQAAVDISPFSLQVAPNCTDTIWKVNGRSMVFIIFSLSPKIEK